VSAALPPRPQRVLPQKRKERWADLNHKIAELTAESDIKRLKASMDQPSLDWEGIYSFSHIDVMDRGYKQPVKAIPEDTLNEIVNMLQLKVRSYGDRYMAMDVFI
jgi:hypothetical protein